LRQKIELLFKIGGFVVSTATAIGASLLLIYCVHISSFPTGISLSDTLLFIFFSVGFIVIYGILFYMLFSMGFLFTPFARGVQTIFSRCKHQKVRYVLDRLPRIGVLTWSDMGTVAAGLVTTLIVLIVWSRDSNLGQGLAASAIGIYFWWVAVVANPKAMSVSNDEETPEESAEKSGWAFKYKKPIAWIMFLSMPLIITFYRLAGPLLDATARLIGVRQDHATVLLSKNHLDLVKFLQGSLDLAGRVVLLPDGGTILKDVDILFQGIGSKTLVAITTPNGGFKVPFPSGDVLPLIPLPSPLKAAAIQS